MWGEIVMSYPIADRNVPGTVPLQNRAYICADSLVADADKVFSTGWACVGYATNLRQDGYVYPVTFAGRPLLLVRGRDGEIRVFHNVCPHRGVKLATAPGPIRGTIRCPYHSWSYDDTGALKSTPRVGGPGCDTVAGLDPAKNGLHPIRSAVWMGMVMVNMDGRAEPFEEYVAPLLKRWSSYSLNQFIPVSSTTSVLKVNSNWKLAVENFLEFYHLPWVHPELNRISPLEDHYLMFDKDFAGPVSSAYTGQSGAAKDLPVLDMIPKENWNIGEYPALYPNVFMGLHRDHFFTMWLEPAAHDRTVEHWQISCVGDGADQARYGHAHDALVENWTSVFAEDVDIVEAMQDGRASPAFNGGNLTPVMDAGTRHFHQWVADRLAA